jgi:hypothetical protein
MRFYGNPYHVPMLPVQTANTDGYLAIEPQAVDEVPA